MGKKEEKFEIKDQGMFLIHDMKALLQEVYDHYRSVELQNDYLREENEHLKSEAYKDEELAKMKEEYERMKADYQRGFTISEEEHNKIAEWAKTLPKASSGAIGGRFKYVFYPTSIGTAGEIVDNVTGKKFTFCEL